MVVVTDPFGRYDERLLHHAFPDLVVRYKDHYVAELDRTPSAFIHPKHRSRARSALRQLTVERCDEPVAHLGEWCGLYDGLIRRHGIVGLSAFSRDSFRFQLSLPGMAAYRAIYQGQTVAMVLSYEHGNEAYYHLSAGSDVGRSLNATHAILWVVLHDLHDAGPSATTSVRPLDPAGRQARASPSSRADGPQQPCPCTYAGGCSTGPAMTLRCAPREEGAARTFLGTGGARPPDPCGSRRTMGAFRPVAGSVCPIGGYFQCELGNGAGYNRGIC